MSEGAAMTPIEQEIEKLAEKHLHNWDAEGRLHILDHMQSALRELIPLIREECAKRKFNDGDLVRVEHPRFSGFGIVRNETLPRPHYVGVELENGNIWDYELETVKAVENPDLDKLPTPIAAAIREGK